MPNAKLSNKDEMKKKSILDLFSKRATSTSSIRLRSFDKRGEDGPGSGGGGGGGNNNVRRSRSQAGSKKLAKLADNADQPVQEGIYEEIQFDLDDDDDDDDDSSKHSFYLHSN